MKNKNLQLIVRTALLLAVTLVFQQLRLLIGNSLPSTIIIGSLVNLALVVAAGTVGWRGSVAISILSPVVAFLEGHLPLPILIPFVAAGNIVIAVAFELIERRKNTWPRMWTGVIVSSLAKTAALYALVVLLFVDVMLPGMGLPGPKASMMSNTLAISFSWPQLVTALIGGAVALPVIRGLRKAFSSGDSK